MGDEIALQSIRGKVIQPGDSDYDTARKVYNGMIDRHPRYIIKCTDVADVIGGLRLARELNLRLAVRGGGHSGSGMGTCDDGVVIDLSPMRFVQVDVHSSTATVGGGALLGDIDHATHPFGLALPTGIISTTGIGGLTLGGGSGYLTRKFGLTIDSLLSADIVLANGSYVTASADENPDLFWAIRGGGGNFGIVTSFVFRLHPLTTVVGGPTLWPLDQAPAVLRWYREFLPSAPEDLNGFFVFLTVPPVPPFPAQLHNRKMCGIVWCYTGDPKKADEVFKPIATFGSPALHDVQSMPYTALQSTFDALYPPGLQWYWKADFLNEISDEAIERHLSFARELPSPHSTMHMYPIDGAAHRVGKSDTAFSFRTARWSQVIVGVDPDPTNNDRLKSWARSYWNAVHPYSAGGAYVNFMMDEGVDRIMATYRDNYERLASIKRTYDPENFFSINQNIKPVS